MNRTMSLLTMFAATGSGGCNPPTAINVRAIAPNTADAQIATGDPGNTAKRGAATTSIFATPPASSSAN